jgi:hypothetical protein
LVMQGNLAFVFSLFRHNHSFLAHDIDEPS